jgi:urease alpha subunit
MVPSLCIDELLATSAPLLSGSTTLHSGGGGSSSSSSSLRTSNQHWKLSCAFNAHDELMATALATLRQRCGKARYSSRSAMAQQETAAAAAGRTMCCSDGV